MFPISTTSPEVSALIFFILTFTLYRSWRKENKNPEMKFFIIFIACLGLGLTFFSFGTGLVPNDLSLNTWFWSIAHLSMFIGSCYLLRFAMRMWNIRWEKKVFYAVLAIAFVADAILIYSRPEVKFIIFPNGVFNWELPPLPGAVIGIDAALSLLSAFWIFISHIKSLPSKVLKIRSLALAAGILLFFVGGPLHSFVTTPLMYFVADLLMVSGVLVMAGGVYVPKFFKEKKPAPAPVNNSPNHS